LSIFQLFLLEALGDENIFTKILILPNEVNQIDQQIQLAAYLEQYDIIDGHIHYSI
jgi:hypothetical protein